MKQPMKLSGLVAAGKVTPPPTTQPSTAFDLPISEPANEATVAGEKELDVALLDDAPYQSRLKINPEHVDETGQSMQSAGQRSPITVRLKPNGRYEIIKGHTRKYAAISRGIKTLRALIVDRNDREAKLDLWLDNEGHTNTDYEYACMFREALDDKFATTQEGVANLFGRSQGYVSKCLGMLKLPEPVLEMLNKEPALISIAAAPVVQELWNTYPQHTDLILQGLQRIVEGADQNGLKPWVLQKVNSAQRANSTRARNHQLPHPSGAAALVTIEKGRDLVLRLADPAMDFEETRKAVEGFLSHWLIEWNNAKSN
jgi:ParB family transcriptional regulator, chromosome partitioning protein